MAFARGLELVEDKGLLAEVAGLVEWPVPLMGRIADDFLHLPPEVLQTSMKEHQKFFSVKNPKTGRIEGFVTVANTQPADHGATILKGNQKVLTARLSDARFFYDNDLRVARAGPESKPMGEWLDGLKSVTFHNKLGSQADRIARIAALAREIAPLVGADADLAEQAANLAKADLRSAMVGEFPELQGLMGMYYARAAGLPDAVALAGLAHSDTVAGCAAGQVNEAEAGTVIGAAVQPPGEHATADHLDHGAHCGSQFAPCQLWFTGRVNPPLTAMRQDSAHVAALCLAVAAAGDEPFHLRQHQPVADQRVHLPAAQQRYSRLVAELSEMASTSCFLPEAGINHHAAPRLCRLY